jgi:hypothetical protein
VKGGRGSQRWAQVENWGQQGRLGKEERKKEKAKAYLGNDLVQLMPVDSTAKTCVSIDLIPSSAPSRALRATDSSMSNGKEGKRTTLLPNLPLHCTDSSSPGHRSQP